MNKKIGIIVGTLIAAIILGTVAYNSNASPVEANLSRDEVRDLIALEYPGEIVEFELEEENGKAIYELEIRGDGVKYDLDIDGDTGQVLKAEEKVLNNKQATTSTATTPNEAEQEELTVEQAIEIAQAEFAGEVIETERDRDDGRIIYEIKLRNDNEKAKFDIDAATGKILEFEIDGQKGKNSSTLEDVMSVEQAKEIALTEFDGKVIEVELDEDDGRYKYELELKSDTQEAEIDIDAKTGEILKLEIENR